MILFDLHLYLQSVLGAPIRNMVGEKVILHCVSASHLWCIVRRTLVATFQKAVSGNALQILQQRTLG